jgi:hypothetical protein
MSVELIMLIIILIIIITHFFEKSKSKLSNYDMMIVGKYLKTIEDFQRIEMVNKKFNNLHLMYHFNPISDNSIFKNVETQHFYSLDDVKYKKPGMFKYVYHFVDKKLMENKFDNEIFIDIPYQIIENNFNILSLWTNKKIGKKLYDSAFNDEDCHSCIGGYNKLTFIVVDDNNNIFGFYYEGEEIDNALDNLSHECNNDKIFMFTLYHKPDYRRMSYRNKYVCNYPEINKNNNNTITLRFRLSCEIHLENKYGQFGLHLNTYKYKNSEIDTCINKFYKNFSISDILGHEDNPKTCNIWENEHTKFKCKRLIVIEMC